MDYSDKIEIDRSKGYPLTHFNAGDYASKGIEWQIDITSFAHHPGCLQDISFNTAGYRADPKAKNSTEKNIKPGPNTRLA